MTATHALVDGLRIIRLCEIPSETYQAWVAAGNPKARFYIPIVDAPAPSFDPETQALVESLVIALSGESITRSWSVREKTPEELRKVWTALEFLERFAPAELAAVEAMARQDQTLASIYRSCLAAQEVQSDDPRTIGGMGYLVAVGILSPARRDEILSGSAPAL